MFYDATINLLHTQVGVPSVAVSGVNCGSIWSASWAKALHK